MSSSVSSLLSKAGDVWCELMHDDIMWPVEGHYRCRTCLREYPVEWGNQEAAAHPAPLRAAEPNFRATGPLSAAGARP